MAAADPAVGIAAAGRRPGLLGGPVRRLGDGPRHRRRYGSMAGQTLPPRSATSWPPPTGRLLAGGAPTAGSSPSVTPPSTGRWAASASTPRSSDMAPTADGHGYWLVASDGGIFAFGDAAFHGSMGGQPLNAPIVGMAPTPTVGATGWWPPTAASSPSATPPSTARPAALHLNAPIVGMAPTADGQRLLAGGRRRRDLRLRRRPVPGSAGSLPLQAPIAGHGHRPGDRRLLAGRPPTAGCSPSAPPSRAPAEPPGPAVRRPGRRPCRTGPPGDRLTPLTGGSGPPSSPRRPRSRHVPSGPRGRARNSFRADLPIGACGGRIRTPPRARPGRVRPDRTPGVPDREARSTQDGPPHVVRPGNDRRRHRSRAGRRTSASAAAGRPDGRPPGRGRGPPGPGRAAVADAGRRRRRPDEPRRRASRSTPRTCSPG